MSQKGPQEASDPVSAAAQSREQGNCPAAVQQLHGYQSPPPETPGQAIAGISAMLTVSLHWILETKIIKYH